MGNTYAVDCECGNSLSVTAAAAGTVIRCECGKDVNVPGLSKLRTLAGQDAYITNPAEKITAEHNAGREPAGVFCLECGGPTENLVEILIECEKQVVVDQQRNTSWDLFWILCFGWLGALKLMTQPSNPGAPDGVVGRRRVVTTHFRLCSNCLPNPSRPPSASKTRRLLYQLKLYQELFAEFPQAEIFFLRTHTNQPGL